MKLIRTILYHFHHQLGIFSGLVLEQWKDKISWFHYTDNELTLSLSGNWVYCVLQNQRTIGPSSLKSCTVNQCPHCRRLSCHRNHFFMQILLAFIQYLYIGILLQNWCKLARGPTSDGRTLEMVEIVTFLTIIIFHGLVPRRRFLVWVRK